MSDKLRAAAQEALEWLRDKRLDTWMYMEGSQFYEDRDEHVKELEAALAEPAQEPMHSEIKKMYEDYFDKCFRESSAQQRPWIGLTDDEIEHLRNDQPWWMVRDIEAKLREKNT